MGEQDLLTAIQNDPRVLRRVLEEIDSNKDFALARGELMAWIWEHRDALNIGQHNLGKDIARYGADAVEGAKKFNLDDYLKRNGKIDNDKMQKRDAQEASATLLNDEMLKVVEVIGTGIQNNRRALRPNGANADAAADARADAEERAEQEETLREIAKYAPQQAGQIRSMINEARTRDGRDAAPEKPVNAAQQKEIDAARQVVQRYASTPLDAPDMGNLAPLITRGSTPGSSNQR